MWRHVDHWSHSIKVDYKPDDEEGIIVKVYFPFDAKVSKKFRLLHYLIRETSYDDLNI